MSDTERTDLGGDAGRARSVHSAVLPVAVTIGIGTAGAALLFGHSWLAGATAIQTGLCAVAAVRRGDRPGDRPQVAVRPTEGEPDIISAIPGPVVAVGGAGAVTALNGAAAAVLPGIRVGQPLSFGLRAPDVLEAVRRAIASGEPATAQFGGRVSSDPIYEVEIRPSPAGADNRAVLLFLRDLSAERQLERMQADFIATVSHELRTPLASMSGFIDTLKGPARDDAKARERFLDVMRGQANRMTRLVNDLLQLSRVELRVHQAPSDPILLGPLVGHMIEILAPLARERDVEMSFAVDEEGGTVVGDRDELLRVAENLIENAIKYGRPGQVEIRVGPSDDGRWVVLSVRDDGPGIAAEHLPRLTERFYRADVTASRQAGGTGLGLAIVKSIVTRHRGRLSIESEPGRGTLVQVSLPAPLGPEAPAAAVI